MRQERHRTHGGGDRAILHLATRMIFLRHIPEAASHPLLPWLPIILMKELSLFPSPPRASSSSTASQIPQAPATWKHKLISTLMASVAVSVLQRNRAKLEIEIYIYVLRDLFQGIGLMWGVLVNVKSMGQARRLETQAGADAANLRQNFFFRKPPSLSQALTTD